MAETDILERISFSAASPADSARLQLGVLASHGGTNLQAIMDACSNGELNARVRVVISNNSRSGALVRARRANIPAMHLSSATHTDTDLLDAAIARALHQHDVEVVALAGYMKKLGPRALSAYRNRIVNIHPALLPKYGGKGMYGERVHTAVLAAGERESGATVHLVDEVYDHGAILAQETIPVMPGDTPESLAARVIECEHTLYSRTLSRIASGDLDLDALAGAADNYSDN